jgi:hypothetical protein
MADSDIIVTLHLVISFPFNGQNLKNFYKVNWFHFEMAGAHGKGKKKLIVIDPICV